MDALPLGNRHQQGVFVLALIEGLQAVKREINNLNLRVFRPRFARISLAFLGCYQSLPLGVNLSAMGLECSQDRFRYLRCHRRLWDDRVRFHHYNGLIPGPGKYGGENIPPRFLDSAAWPRTTVAGKVQKAKLWALAAEILKNCLRKNPYKRTSAKEM